MHDEYLSILCNDHSHIEHATNQPDPSPGHDPRRTLDRPRNHQHVGKNMALLEMVRRLNRPNKNIHGRCTLCNNLHLTTPQSHPILFFSSEYETSNQPQPFFCVNLAMTWLTIGNDVLKMKRMCRSSGESSFYMDRSICHVTRAEAQFVRVKPFSRSLAKII
jgi:hypothetical protein